MFSALNATVADILSRLTGLKNHADSLLAGINGIMHKTYNSEMQQVDEESRKARSASDFAMSAKYNVTAHQNMSLNLNNTAIEAEGSLLVSMEQLDQMRPRIDTVTSLTEDALLLINQTKVRKKIW